jgi:geranylgeranyl diphosphate synthase type I
VRVAVDHELARFLDAHVARAATVGDAPRIIAEATRALSLRGGKRFRPALLAAAYEACGGEGGLSVVVLAGVALELLQSYLLIHDDWMDNDDVRRGGPTVHAALGAAFGSRSLGATSAVLAGDHASGLAQAALLGVPLAPPRVCEAAREFARIQEDVALGQMLDVHMSAGDPAAVERMHDLKTGSYTVRGPLAMGARLAGASEGQLRVLERFAAPLGIAFQLRDDLLGTFGDPTATGKPAGSDLRQGKRTALLVEADGQGDVEVYLARAMAAPPEDDAPVRELQALLESLGARERVEARLEALLDEARGALTGPAAALLAASGRRLL